VEVKYNESVTHAFYDNRGDIFLHRQASKMVFKWAIFQSEEKLPERLEKAELEVIMTNSPA
jgi:hypothetical protein